MMKHRGVVVLSLSLILALVGNVAQAFNFQSHSSPRCNKFLVNVVGTGELETEISEEGGDTVSSEIASVATAQQRGKVNEIDFCMAPSDVSLSRAYALSSSSTNSPGDKQQLSTKEQLDEPKKILSLTRALNSASNRAVRRILLSRAWPSAEALNESLRQVLAAEKNKGKVNDVSNSGPKCPVPRPVLNILTGGSKRNLGASADVIGTPDRKQGRTDEEWVADQIEAFRQTHGTLPGYSLAESYLECILSLATSGNESPKVVEVLAGGVYSESYRRFINVLKSVGTEFVEVPGTNPPLTKISKKLVDSDICLSTLDKINLRKESLRQESEEEVGVKETSAVADDIPANTTVTAKEGASIEEKPSRRKKVLSLLKGRKDERNRKSSVDAKSTDDEEREVTDESSRDDLGGVLLSSNEPSMTRQLNVLSNIVKRALLFGGDQEILVLSETLEADKAAFIQRWYPGTSYDVDVTEESRPGVQFFNNLVFLLRKCYSEGSISELEPPLPICASYANSYERLVANLVELGSGYINPWSLQKILSVLPKTPTEEFGRFAKWETSLRKISPDINAYPSDLIGKWQVQDEVGGETIGVSIVEFQPDGQVAVSPPMLGLRWRLDPGPTHLDTCTFQVLSEDGAILQYRGFVDRGARLESRFSRRSIKIQGAVTFQMRDGDALIMGDDYRKDMLPVSSKTATTRFVMKKDDISESPKVEPYEIRYGRSRKNND